MLMRDFILIILFYFHNLKFDKKKFFINFLLLFKNMKTLDQYFNFFVLKRLHVNFKYSFILKKVSYC